MTGVRDPHNVIYSSPAPDLIEPGIGLSAIWFPRARPVGRPKRNLASGQLSPRSVKSRPATESLILRQNYRLKVDGDPICRIAICC